MRDLPEKCCGSTLTRLYTWYTHDTPITMCGENKYGPSASRKNILRSFLNIACGALSAWTAPTAYLVCLWVGHFVEQFRNTPHRFSTYLYMQSKSFLKLAPSRGIKWLKTALHGHTKTLKRPQQSLAGNRKIIPGWFLKYQCMRSKWYMAWQPAHTTAASHNRSPEGGCEYFYDSSNS